MDKVFRIILLFFVFSSATHAQNLRRARVTEYQIKAAFLYNFAKFVDWPKEVVEDTTQPLIIGILGRDPFGSDLDEMIAGKTVKGKKIVIKRFDKIEDWEFCHLLFISSSERRRMKKNLAILREFNVLTVGETPDFAVNGGVIRLFNQNNKVRFAINIEAAERSHLKISSRLLNLARIVENSNHKGKN
ncbi:MAG: YfiR family protein [bacterium]